MERLIKSGKGWRVGWNPSAVKYQALLGNDDWAIELTEAELADFCRLLQQLTETIQQIAAELMAEEKITCEAESDLLWMEVSGYAHAYSLRFILSCERGVEGAWEAGVVPQLRQALETLKVF
ncbi:DUF1818 family protein [Calothrix sp. 336/3]|uniref:DUF1818 family protein n=1 Tax=Calothrix sp. 336/3 TaxID=1337936 RepID=UPI0004E30F26|nr:DUF1818 family protein [Calothrix sp. 336/3]AKG20406.1 hypothetical protein IJ00_02885 [Calothrix sp. 336/3]